MRRLVVKSKGKRYLVTVPEYDDISEAAIVATPPPAVVVPTVFPVVAVAVGAGDFVASSYPGTGSTAAPRTASMTESTIYGNQILFDGLYYKNYFTSSFSLSASIKLYQPSTYRLTATQISDTSAYGNTILESGIYNVSVFNTDITESQNVGTINALSGIYSLTAPASPIPPLTGSIDYILLTGGSYLYSPTVSEMSIQSASKATGGEYIVTSASYTDVPQNLLISELTSASIYNITTESTTEQTSLTNSMMSGEYVTTRFIPNTGSFGTGSFSPGSGENFDRLRYGNVAVTGGDYRLTYGDRNHTETLNKVNIVMLQSGEYLPESTVFMTAETTDYIVFENDTNNRLTLEN